VLDTPPLHEPQTVALTVNCVPLALVEYTVERGDSQCQGIHLPQLGAVLVALKQKASMVRSINGEDRRFHLSTATTDVSGSVGFTRTAICDPITILET